MSNDLFPWIDEEDIIDAEGLIVDPSTEPTFNNLMDIDQPDSDDEEISDDSEDPTGEGEVSASIWKKLDQHYDLDGFSENDLPDDLEDLFGL